MPLIQFRTTKSPTGTESDVSDTENEDDGVSSDEEEIQNLFYLFYHQTLLDIKHILIKHYRKNNKNILKFTKAKIIQFKDTIFAKRIKSNFEKTIFSLSEKSVAKKVIGALKMNSYNLIFFLFF